MIVFVTTDNGTGWISKGGGHLTSKTEYARKFDNFDDVAHAIENLQNLIDNRSPGWEDTVILQTETAPDNSPERECIHWKSVQ